MLREVLQFFQDGYQLSVPVVFCRHFGTRRLFFVSAGASEFGTVLNKTQSRCAGFITKENRRCRLTLFPVFRSALVCFHKSEVLRVVCPPSGRLLGWLDRIFVLKRPRGAEGFVSRREIPNV